MANFIFLLTFFLLLAHECKADTALGCDEEWYNANQQCYLFVNNKKVTWSEAEQECNQKDASLMYFDTVGEVNWYKSYVSNYPAPAYWISLNDLSWQGQNQPGTGQWKWGKYTKANISMFQWNQSPANDGVNNCGGINAAGKMSDVGCNSTQGFICDIEHNGGQCPDSTWTKTSAECYYVSNTSDVSQLMTWDQARAKCASFGSNSHLVTVNEANDQAFLQNALPYVTTSTYLYWTGLTYKNNGWQWFNGATFNQQFFNWAKEPDNVAGKEDCVVVRYNGQLSDRGCNMQQNFICKKNQDYNFPMAPEHVYVSKEDLSEYTKQTAVLNNIDLEKLSDRKCLCLSLRDKIKYTLHYRCLKFYVRHGLELTKIHRVIAFTQVPFLEPFMRHCSEQRIAACSPMYRKVWKNIANLVAGKSYENARNYIDVRICTNSESLKRYVSRPTFDCLRVFHENLTAVQLHRPVVTLARPITVGFCVLELSKLAMYSFYYDFVKPDLAKGGKVNFLCCDTDSLVLKITGVSDLDDRFKKAGHLFDFSNLPEHHPLKSDHNRMVPGKFKFELPGHVCCEFVALSPKCYSMKTDKGFKQARKGCPVELRHDLYRDCLVSNTCQRMNVKQIRNYGQKLYQVSVTKNVLNVLDTKRFHFNALDSVSFGHYSLADN